MVQVLQFEIRHLTAPLEATDLLRLLGHKGSPWVEDLRNRIEGKYADSADHFFVAYAAAEPIAHVWYNVSPADRRLGLLGHVYTREEYRRQGISARLMEAAMADFLQRGGLVMQLYTSTPHTVGFYEKLGFENLYASPVYHETDWYLRYPLGSQELLQEWFLPAPCRIRELSTGDLPGYCLLYNLEYRTRLKDWAQGIGLGLEAEFALINTLNKIAGGQGVCYVLENGETIVGIGSLIRNSFPHQSHLAAIDCYVHPAYQAKTAELIDACLSRRDALGVEILYAACVDEDRKRTFAGLGFRQKAILRSHYKIKDQRFDCEVYQFPPGPGKRKGTKQ